MGTFETPLRPVLAFVGLGVMGGPMAGHLVRHGYRVQAYNRTLSKARAWQQAHQGVGAIPATVADTPREAALGADILMTCVGNDDDLRSVLLGPEGAFAGLKPGAVVVDHSTASANVARELHGLAQTVGIAFIDAPMSGGQVGAEKGLLTLMCGGEAQAFARVQPVLASYARAVTHVGPSGSGQLAKMVNQICIAGLLQGLSEALAFGEKAGLDMPQVLSVIGQGAAQSWQMDNRGLSMLADRFDFGFAVDWMRKDLGIVLDEAGRNGAALPVTEIVNRFYADLQALGGGRWDTSSLIRRLR
ncbi:MAG: NAD(P)-dependent oxidoreductase [Leptothrix ochracea]|uniref:NAD(P)-dependent oxidoreductase n=1 Tax=Leptothrix ochracea TaxID=735331 RepID=UPI0034E1EE6E